MQHTPGGAKKEDKESKCKSKLYERKVSESDPASSWKRLPIAWRIKGKAKDESILAGDIAQFLRRLEFKEPQAGEVGTTWIELFVVFKAMGYADPIPKGANEAKAQPSLQNQLQCFKNGIRKVAGEGIQGDCKKFLGASAVKGYVLQRLGVTSHCAAIHGKINMSKRVQEHVDSEILRANGNKAKDLRSQPKGEEKITIAKLSLKRKVGWSNAVKKFPNDLSEEFQLEAGKPEAELCETKTKLKGRRRKGPSRVVAPVHDFVQPLVAKGDKRKASTPAPPKEEFTLRANMLSARLRERFGYLCTEAG